MTSGFSLLETLIVLAIVSTLAAASIPLAHGGLDRSRTSGAASYLASRLTLARLEAVKRSAFVAVQFVKGNDGYGFRLYVDGNRNGVLTGDIAQGIDRAIAPEEHLDYHFTGVAFGMLPNVPSPDADEGDDRFDATDPIQIGRTSLLSFNPNGSATAGTLYIKGHYAQFAIRVLGVTARLRILEFNMEDGTWRPR